MVTVSRSSNVRIGLVLTAWLAAIAVPAAAAEWLYTVRPGDEIWNIASKYCGSPSYADRIIEFNQLADERRIRPGSRLRIPVEWLVRQPASAEVLNVRGSAVLLTPEPEPARVGRIIEMGYRLQTADGSVVVGFADGSSLLVAADSDVLFNVLTAYGDTGMVDTNLRFYRGRGTSTVIRRNDGSSFRISSPAGTAAVRGTEFRVAAAPEQSLTETLEGEVGFIRDTETALPAGYGLAARATGVVREPLLPAPTWISGPGGYATGSDIRWQALADAQGYRASIFLAADLANPVQVSITETPSLTLAELPPAAYVVAVRGIAQSDLEGYESPLAIELTTPAPEPSAPQVVVVSAVDLAWEPTSTGPPYAVEVARDRDFGDIVWQGPVQDRNVAAPQLAPGNYYWRVKDTTSDFSAPTAIKVRPDAPRDLALTRNRLDLELSWAPAGADSFALTISRNTDLTNAVVDTVVTQPTFTGTMPAAGDYHIRIVATENGVESEPTITETTLTRPPWWLLGLLVVPLFF